MSRPGHRHERAVVRDAVLRLALRGGELVTARELQAVVGVREDRVGAPLAAIGGAAPGAQAAAPLVAEQHLVAGVVERGRVPVREVRVGHVVDAAGPGRVANVEQDPVAGTGAGGEADRRVGGDVVALVGGGRLLRAAAVIAAHVEAVDRARYRVGKDARGRDDLRVLRRRQRHLDHLDAKERRVGVLLRRAGRAAGELGRGAHRARALHVDVDVLRVARVGHERVRVRVRVRTAAGLHRGHLLRMVEVADVEDANATQALGAHGVGHRLGAAVEPAVRGFGGDEQEVAVHRGIALPALACKGEPQLGRARVGDVEDLEARPAALKDKRATRSRRTSAMVCGSCDESR